MNVSIRHRFETTCYELLQLNSSESLPSNVDGAVGQLAKDFFSSTYFFVKELSDHSEYKKLYRELIDFTDHVKWELLTEEEKTLILCIRSTSESILFIDASSDKEEVFTWLKLRQRKKIDKNSTPLDILEAFETIREKRVEPSSLASERAFSKMVVAALELNNIDQARQLFQGNEEAKAKAMAHVIDADELELTDELLTDQELKAVLLFLRYVDFSQIFFESFKEEEICIASCKNAKHIKISLKDNEILPSFPKDIESFVLSCDEIVDVNLTNYKKLRNVTLENSGKLKKIVFPESVSNVKISQNSNVKEIKFESLSNLITLCVRECEKLEEINIPKADFLKECEISYCNNLEKISFESAHLLNELKITKNKKLSYFSLNNASLIKEIDFFDLGDIKEFKFNSISKKANVIFDFLIKRLNTKEELIFWLNEELKSTAFTSKSSDGEIIRGCEIARSQFEEERHEECLFSIKIASIFDLKKIETLNDKFPKNSLGRGEALAFYFENYSSDDEFKKLNQELIEAAPFLRQFNYDGSLFSTAQKEEEFISKLSKIQNLIIHNSKVQELSFPSSMLREIYFNESQAKIINLVKCKSLNKCIFFECNLKVVSFPKSISEVIFNNCLDLQNIKSESFDNLSTLEISDSRNIEHLFYPSVIKLNALKLINCSGIKTIELHKAEELSNVHVENLCDLETISLFDTPKIENLKLENNKKLTKVQLNQRQI